MSYKLRGNLGKHNPQPVPQGSIGTAWVGPAKMVEYSNFQHRRWYWIANFASGDVANQMVHDVDNMRWGLGLDEPCRHRDVHGRTATYPATTTTPTRPTRSPSLCQWADNNALVTVEIRHWYTNNEAQMRDKYPFMSPDQCVGEIFFGAKAT